MGTQIITTVIEQQQQQQNIKEKYFVYFIATAPFTKIVLFSLLSLLEFLLCFASYYMNSNNIIVVCHPLLTLSIYVNLIL